ncbi:hypothetical protein K439DRAFT_1621630 [Ramaria rubella]|nr:hypothetical protein K439DRAFT_1621630 [Ramaria rubella]
MPSPKRRKKPITSVPTLEADIAVAEAKQARAQKKADVRKPGGKHSPSEASLSLSTSKPKRQKKRAIKRDGEEDAASEGEDGKRTNSAAIVKLINMISDNRVWRQAFNFNTSNSMEPINSGGKKTADHQREIAKVLLQDDPSGKLRKKYFELQNELGATGHGLIEDERELEIWDDSAISNVWEKMQKIFPWYKDLSWLLKASPVVDREASVNSATDLDLTVLGT